MNPDRKRVQRQSDIVLCVFLFFVTVYLGLKLAPNLHEGRIDFMGTYQSIISEPFRFSFVEGTPKCLLICFGLYLLGIMVYLTSRRQYRRGIEHGSAGWAAINQLKKRYGSRNKHKVVYTQQFGISYKPKWLFKHKHNMNTLVVGGPGSGKSRNYVFPNLLQNVHDSFVILDPKGESVRTMGEMLRKNGVRVKVLDLIHPERSWGYNPFQYIRNDDDVQKIGTAIFKATTPKDAKSNDPFWEDAGLMLLKALMYLLYHFGAPDEKNFAMVMELLRSGEVREDDDNYVSPLDRLFERVQMSDANHIAVKYYQDYHCGAAKTLKSIQITLKAHLEKFNVASVAELTRYDELNLDEIGDQPTALFCVIPDNDTSYNFIVAMLYIQLFQQLYTKADDTYKGRLPCFVHVMMDEFANVYVSDDFLGILATCRSRNIGISVILQNFAQLKALYKEAWENILGQCDQFLYLGGNESSTHEYISKMMGKETIDTNTYGLSRGNNGNYSTNYQNAGRELMTPDEIRTMAWDNALLFVKGEPPLFDRKYDVLKHRRAKETPLLGNAGLGYVYGTTEKAVAGIEFLDPEERYPGEIDLGELEEDGKVYEDLSKNQLERKYQINGGN